MRKLGLFLIFCLCQIAVVLAPFIFLYSLFRNEDKAFDMLKAYDRLGNTEINGSDAETISSRAYRGMTEGNKAFCVLCKLLDMIQANHCKDSAGV